MSNQSETYEVGYWRWKDTKKAVSTDVEIYTPRVNEFQHWFVSLVYAVNQTSGNTLCNVSVRRGETLFPVCDLVLSTAGQSETHHAEIWLFPGESLRFYFTGVSVNDNLEVCVHGLKEFRKKD